MSDNAGSDRDGNVEAILPTPNWTGVHIETQNSQLRTLIDAIRRRLGDAPWATDGLREVAETLNDAAVDFTNTLYSALPEAEHLFVNGERVIQDYERDVLLPRSDLSGTRSEEEGDS